MNVLILEDEKSSALRLKKLILRHSKSSEFNLFFAETIVEAKKYFSTETFELLFLDLQLKNEDGFSLLQNLVSESFLTIVVSAYSERAMEAFDNGVFDFIPKPIFEERLFKSLDRFHSNRRHYTKTKRLFIKSRNKLEAIPLKNVIFMQPAERYTEIILLQGIKKLHNLSLDKIIKILPANFQRVHRSYIVNLDFIERIISHSGSKYTIELKNNTELPLGRSYAKKIKSLIQ